MFEEAKPPFIGLGVVINIARGALKNNLPFFFGSFYTSHRSKSTFYHIFLNEKFQALSLIK